MFAQQSFTPNSFISIVAAASAVCRQKAVVNYTA